MLRQDKRFIIFLFLVPTILALLLYKGIGATGHSNGADQAVPGFSVMFGFYIITYIGVSHYREHAWGAWTMVRAAGIPRLTAAIGVLAPYYLLGVAQLTIMLLVGGVALGAHVRGSPIMVFCLILATEATIVGIAVTLLNVTSSLTAMQQTTQMIVLVLGAIGGALLPPPHHAPMVAGRGPFHPPVLVDPRHPRGHGQRAGVEPGVAEPRRAPRHGSAPDRSRRRHLRHAKGRRVPLR